MSKEQVYLDYKFVMRAIESSITHEHLRSCCNLVVAFIDKHTGTKEANCCFILWWELSIKIKNYVAQGPLF